MTDEDVPLDIAGHEEREPPRGSEDRAGSDATREDRPSDARNDAATDEEAGPERPDGGTELLAGDADAGAADGPAQPDLAPEEPGGDEDDVEPVEVLVGLAEDGEIDPWDIDIVAVTDKFLDRLDEADLRTSGRALFYASVLLRMKGDAMLEDDDEAEEAWEEPWEEAMHAGGSDPGPEMDPFASLEEEMDRRLERKRARGMPQTLDELVRDLREAERDTWWKESREYDTSDSPQGFQRGTQELDYRSGDDFRMDDEPSAADVTEKTHSENIDEVITDVQTELWDHYDQGRAEVLFREISGAGGSRVQTYLALLFLAHRGQVRLQQDDLFGDLWVQDPAAATGSDEAIAD